MSVDELTAERQLIVFESEACPFCKQFRAQVLDQWQADVPIAATMVARPPEGWELKKSLFATPTIVLFEDGREVSRYTG